MQHHLTDLATPSFLESYILLASSDAPPTPSVLPLSLLGGPLPVPDLQNLASSGMVQASTVFLSALSFRVAPSRSFLERAFMDEGKIKIFFRPLKTEMVCISLTLGERTTYIWLKKEFVPCTPLVIW